MLNINHRAMRRRFDRKRPIADRIWPRNGSAQETRDLPNGYAVLHHTGGWKKVSALRVKAQMAIARMFEIGGMVAAQRRTQPTPPKTYHKPTNAPMPPSMITRQQIRFAKRRGIDLTPPPVVVEKPKRVRKSRAKVKEVAA